MELECTGSQAERRHEAEELASAANVVAEDSRINNS